MPRDSNRRRPDSKPFVACGGAAGFTAAAGGEAPRLARFRGRGYTGQPMTPEGWWTPVVIDLSGVSTRQQVPVLRQHDHEQIVGHSEAVTISPDGIDFEGVLSGQPEHVAKVLGPGLNGFPWQMSVGATPLRTEHLDAGEEATVNGRAVYGPLVISRETEIGEVSFVPLGADGDTSATVSASRGNRAMSFKAALKQIAAGKYADDEIDQMTEEEAKAALKECMRSADEPAEPDGDEAKPKAKAADEDEKEDKRAEAAARRRVLAARRAEADEVTRCDAIKAACQKHGVTHFVRANGNKVNLAAHAIAEGWTAEKAEVEAIKAARPTAGGPTVYAPAAPELTDAVLEAAVFQAASPTEFRLFDETFYQAQGGATGRPAVPGYLAARVRRELGSRYDDKTQQAAHTLFKGRASLQKVLVAAARGNGYTGDSRVDDGNGEEVLRFAAGHPRAIRADGVSNYSLSNVLANVLNKMMLAGYLYVEQSWREFAGIRSVNDFKPTKSINLFGDFIYESVGATGELKSATLSDQAFANQADQYGRILTIDRKAIINDDLGALTTVPMLLGRGAGLKLNKTFWSTFLSPGNDDGGSTAFFAATHTISGQSANSNYVSGGSSALSSDSLKTAVTTFNKQVDPAGYPLGIDPEVLLYPPELDVTAVELMNAQYIVMGGLASTSSASKQPNTNIWKGRYKPVMSRYLSNSSLTGYSTTGWYLLAGPGVLPVIECAFLNGADTPTVQQAGVDYQFDRLGMSVRGIFDFGVTMQNFRGGVKSAGA